MDLQELKVIAQAELQKHGLQAWAFGLSRTKRRLGACNYRAKRIEIAEYYAAHNSADKVLDTLLHEIAHALAGPKARHGPAWKAMALKLGATPRSCDTSDETIVMPGDWQATCQSCHKTYHKYRRPQRLSGFRCRCAAKSPLVFQYKGDPERQPAVPLTIEQAARWEARCGGCQTLHLRIRKPKPGVWRCRCPHRCELLWRARRVDDDE